MTKRSTLFLIVVPCIVAALSISALCARDEAPSNWRSLEKQYAEANLGLAQARLAVAQSQNKSVAGTVSKQTMDQLESGVGVVRDWVKQLAANGRPNTYSPQIVAAEGVIQSLEANHAESLKANQLQPRSVPDVDLQREQAEIDVAKAKLAALRALPGQSPEVRVEWQIRMLQDDISSLWARPLIED